MSGNVNHGQNSMTPVKGCAVKCLKSQGFISEFIISYGNGVRLFIYSSHLTLLLLRTTRVKASTLSVRDKLLFVTFQKTISLEEHSQEGTITRLKITLNDIQSSDII